MSIRIIGEINAGMLPRRGVHFEPLTREEAHKLAQDAELMSWSAVTLYLKEKVELELGRKVRIAMGSTQPLVLKPGHSWLLARINPLKDALDWWLITIADDTDIGS